MSRKTINHIGLKSKVFSLALKGFKLVSILNALGCLFHRVGAATWKALSPKVFLDLNVGGASNSSSFDLRL